ncbi:hypothetical protein [Azospirillum rugosum]|uniref:Uncharacterized protein n=1 Tax=Azospirillum rugosum TaxID=416170 RepID=A0ABS4SDB2_9PROT|nr:hypothetical protein [Azospirillum rugosum]MBP2290549.1 hypothetical protein [Azospirillum rugosum]MDQ0525437.1 hypothetical protein [Azospirillum rugosum]
MMIEEVQARLRAAHARIGHEGRFALTLSLNGTEECYITHWFRPEPHAFEDCKAVGSGTIAECLTALDRYVAAYRRKPTDEEVGRTLGLLPADAAAAKRGRPRSAPRKNPGVMMAAE